MIDYELSENDLIFSGGDVELNSIERVEINNGYQYIVRISCEYGDSYPNEDIWFEYANERCEAEGVIVCNPFTGIYAILKENTIKDIYGNGNKYQVWNFDVPNKVIETPW